MIINHSITKPIGKSSVCVVYQYKKLKPKLLFYTKLKYPKVMKDRVAILTLASNRFVTEEWHQRAFKQSMKPYKS